MKHLINLFSLLFAMIILEKVYPTNNRLKNQTHQINEQNKEIKHFLNKQLKGNEKVYSLRIEEPKPKKEKKKLTRASDQTWKVVKIIFGTYLLFSIIAFFKLYEESYLLKKMHIRNNFEKVVEFNHETMSTQEVEDNTIYTSGNVNILEYAIDPLLKYQNLNYVKIKREVSIFDPTTKNWELFDFNLLPKSITEFTTTDNTIKLKFSDSSSAELPKVFSELFTGTAQLNSLNLTKAQLLHLEKYEKAIDISNCNFSLPKRVSQKHMTNTPGGDDEELIALDTDFSVEIKENSIFISPKNSDGVIKLRVLYFGYECKTLSIISDVKNSTFKARMTPPDFNNLKLDDSYSKINRPPSMKLNPNIYCDFFNVIACFCLSGPPSYSPSEEAGDDATNWVFEDIATKDEIINSQHGVNYSRVILVRLIYWLIIFLVLLFFWEILLFICLNVSIPKKVIRNHLLLLNVGFSLLIIILVMIYSNISYATKNFFNMCICCGLVIAASVIGVKEIIRLI